MMQTIILTLFRTFFSTLSAVAPRLAGHLAFKLFCRPPKAKLATQFQKKMLVTAREVMKSATQQTIKFEGQGGQSQEVNVYTFEPESSPTITGTVITGTTLIIHGWSSRATHMLAFVPPLLEKGQRVIAVDLPAHGESSGRSFHLALGVQALHAVKAETPEWNNIIAHSLGGAVTTSLVAGSIKGFDAVSVEKIVLMSTPNEIPKIFSDFSKMLGLNVKAQAVLDERVLQLAGNPLNSFIGRDQLVQAGIPTLVMHDPDDKEVSSQEGVSLAENNDIATYHAINGVGHRRILYSEEAVKLAVDFCTT